jgi:hypothetical protein
MMNQRLKPVRNASFALLFMLLAACSMIPVTGEQTSQVTPTAPEAPTAQPATPTTAPLQPTTEPTAAATATVVPTSTPPPPLPVFTSSPTPLPAAPFVDPYVVTVREAEVRVGPGSTFELSHAFGAGTQLPVQGRSVDGQWWAVPGPGDGPGPLGWISAFDVNFFGDVSLVPVLTPPSSSLPNVPVHVDPGSAPSNACVVEPMGSDLGPVFIRLGPGEQFNVSYQLGGWAEVLKAEMGWYMILLGPGENGWVKAQEVQASGACP